LKKTAKLEQFNVLEKRMVDGGPAHCDPMYIVMLQSENECH